MIVNLRGTNGAGKTSAVRALMRQAGLMKKIYGAPLGLWMPEAQKLRFAHIEPDVFVLGPYGASGCDGCDRIQPFDLIPPLLEKYAARGHVVFEGALNQHMLGRGGRGAGTAGTGRRGALPRHAA